MKTRAAVLRGLHQEWIVEEIDLDPPRAGEVLVEWKMAALCHSDEHMVTGDMVVPGQRMFPIVGGHEGAGIVVEVGEGVESLKPGV